MTARLARLAAAAVAVLAGAMSALIGVPAQAAAPVGYVRLAHLSPDTPAVDVYLARLHDASFTPQRFPHVGYGVMSQYLALPIGSYTVSMRKAGDPESSPPVLTTTVDVTEGGAYTVAGVGVYAKLGLTVLTDDLSQPAKGKAKVRVIQASVESSVLDVSLVNGTPVATAVQFGTTTPYELVSPGSWTLRLKPSRAAKATTVSATLGVGNVYSLLVLDGPNGLRAELRADARGDNPPDGGVETGSGGTAAEFPATAQVHPLLWVGAGTAALLMLLALALRKRRLAGRRS